MKVTTLLTIVQLELFITLLFNMGYLLLIHGTRHLTIHFGLEI